MDTQKKERVGNFENAGRLGCPAAVTLHRHDFPQAADGRALPYGLYDRPHHPATMYGAPSADTPTVAVDNLAHWGQPERPQRLPGAPHRCRAAEGGGSNSARRRVFKQHRPAILAEACGRTLTVCH